MESRKASLLAEQVPASWGEEKDPAMANPPVQTQDVGKSCKAEPAIPAIPAEDPTLAETLPFDQGDPFTTIKGQKPGAPVTIDDSPSIPPTQPRPDFESPDLKTKTKVDKKDPEVSPETLEILANDASTTRDQQAKLKAAVKATAKGRPKASDSQKKNADAKEKDGEEKVRSRQAKRTVDPEVDAEVKEEAPKRRRKKREQDGEKEEQVGTDAKNSRSKKNNPPESSRGRSANKKSKEGGVGPGDDEEKTGKTAGPGKETKKRGPGAVKEKEKEVDRTTAKKQRKAKEAAPTEREQPSAKRQPKAKAKAKAVKGNEVEKEGNSKAYPKTLARRYCPTKEPSKAWFLAVRAVFENQLQHRLKAPTTFQDLCVRFSSVIIFSKNVVLWTSENPFRKNFVRVASGTS